jgi:DinB family
VNAEIRFANTQVMAPAAAQIAHLLHQLATVVDALSDMDYKAERAREVSGSVGGHVRHCLDHVSALVAGLPSRCIGYDARTRGTDIERRRDVAVSEALRLAEALASVRAEFIDVDVYVGVRSHTDSGPDQVVRSTLGRELAFVASHTIHHFAIVALLLRDMGIGVPRRFGYAPSTPSPELAA